MYAKESIPMFKFNNKIWCAEWLRLGEDVSNFSIHPM